jgi:phosphonate transport system substrate-binding protein
VAASPPPQRAPRVNARFALPSSLGTDIDRRAARLQFYLRGALGKDVELIVAPTYEQLARDLLSGRVDAAWAPPFVCARIEAMGVRVLVRGVRSGASTYRAALVCRKDSTLTLDTLAGAHAAWSDRDSVGGYLLALATLREKGVDPAKAFGKQDFVGSYTAALEAVRGGKADLTSVFAPSVKAGLGDVTGIDEVLPGAARDFKVLAFTDEAPNDGVAVAMNAPATLVAELEKALLGLHTTEEGRQLLEQCFHAERFEAAPRMGYRALYRVALASL